MSLRKIKDEIRLLIRENTVCIRKFSPIDVISCLDYEIFLSFASQCRPFLCRGIAETWPLTLGGLDLFSDLYGSLIVKVRIGSYSRANHELKFEETTIADYIEKISAIKSFSQDIGYAGYIPAPKTIEKYIYYPKYFENILVKEPFHFWLGPQKTYTALHSDTCDKLIYQSVGHKKWYLLAPRFHDFLNIDPDFGRGYDTSPFDPRVEPKEKRALYLYENVIKADIHRGDILFLPGGWYHAVESLSTSLSFEYKSDPVPLSIKCSQARSRFLNKILNFKL